MLTSACPLRLYAPVRWRAPATLLRAACPPRRQPKKNFRRLPPGWRRLQHLQKRPYRPRLRTPPQRHRANAARSLCIRNPHVPAPRIPIHRHLRHDRHSHARTHHAQQTRKLSALEHDLRMQPRAIASRHRRVAKAVSITQQKKWLGLQILERQRPPRSKLVLRRQRSKQPLGQQRRRLELVPAHWQRQNRHINRTRSQPLQQHRRNFFHHRHLHLRKFSRVSAQVTRQQIRRHRRNRAHHHRTSQRVLPLHRISPRRFQLPQHRPRPRQKRLPHFRYAHTAPQPVKKPRSQLILQLQDLLRKRRLRHVRLLRRTRKRSRVRHRTEVTQLMQFHRLCLSIVSELDIGTIARQRSTLARSTWGITFGRKYGGRKKDHHDYGRRPSRGRQSKFAHRRTSRAGRIRRLPAL